MRIERINPSSLHHNPAFTQVVVLPPAARTVLIGGQNAVDGEGRVIGLGDIAAQTEKAVENVFKAVRAIGGTPAEIVKLNIYAVDGHDLGPAFERWLRLWGGCDAPPAITVVRVAGLAHPDFLVEIDATAVVPDDV
jgi:enamine deaminase RidA (YjgF/YER057c/UK114 family)